MNRRQRRTLDAIFTRPTLGTIRFADVESLMRALGAEVLAGDGSRVGFVVRGLRIVLHRPHPQKEMKRYAVEALRDYLQDVGITPSTV